MKRSLLQAEDEKIFTEQIIQLNVFGKQLGKLNYVTAMTDVTGFGLLGHLIEMTTGNNLCSEINFDLIPKISCIDFYLEQNTLPDATFRNWNAYNKLIEISPEVDATKAFQLLPDPQTNGGLLIAVNKNYHLEFVELMKQNGMEKFTQPIGKFVTKHEKQIKFVN